MPAKPRSEIFDPDVTGVYHCWNRVVQRRHLFGFDQVSGKDYGYRKIWLRDRLKELAAVAAIDVLDYAILDNHLHVVLRNRPEIVDRWNDTEVATRWWFLCPMRRNEDGSAAEPTDVELQYYEKNADELRKRLSDISWFMRLLCQPIARRANSEDNLDGRFFAKRFDCKRLESVADLLACSLYVDLNAIHAGIAATPEHSAFTSAFDRIRSRWRGSQDDLDAPVCQSLADDADADAWLAPIFLDESSEAYEDLEAAMCANPMGAGRVSDKGFLPLTCQQYLHLLDQVGRVIRKGKRGHIPHRLPPILDRLHIGEGNLLDSIVEFFDGRSAFRPAPG